MNSKEYTKVEVGAIAFSEWIAFRDINVLPATAFVVIHPWSAKRSSRDRRAKKANPQVRAARRSDHKPPQATEKIATNTAQSTG